MGPAASCLTQKRRGSHPPKVRLRHPPLPPPGKEKKNFVAAADETYTKPTEPTTISGPYNVARVDGFHKHSTTTTGMTVEQKEQKEQNRAVAVYCASSLGHRKAFQNAAVSECPRLLLVLLVDDAFAVQVSARRWAKRTDHSSMAGERRASWASCRARCSRRVGR